MSIFNKKGKAYDEFISIPPLYKSLSYWHIRSSILNSINANKNLFKGKILDFGCGKMPYKRLIEHFPGVSEYIGIDIESAIVYDIDVAPDMYWDGKIMPISDLEFDTVFATEVLEHCSNPQQTLDEIYRILKCNGSLFATVSFLYPTHEIPNDHYRYTPFSLFNMLQSSGFQNIKISALGGWKASLAQMLGLYHSFYSTNSFFSKVKRKMSKPFIVIIMRYLYATDTKPKDVFQDVQMCTGFICTAKK